MVWVHTGKESNLPFKKSQLFSLDREGNGRAIHITHRPLNRGDNVPVSTKCMAGQLIIIG